MHKIYHGDAPTYLCNLAKVSHSHNTRNSQRSFVIPQVKSHGSKTFTFNGIKLWNSLPKHLKCVKSRDEFKSKCRSHLFNVMKNEEQSEFTV